MIYDALFAGLVWVKNACIGQSTFHEALLITNSSEMLRARSAGDILNFSDCRCCGVHHEREAGAGVQEIMIT